MFQSWSHHSLHATFCILNFLYGIFCAVELARYVVGFDVDILTSCLDYELLVDCVVWLTGMASILCRALLQFPQFTFTGLGLTWSNL